MRSFRYAGRDALRLRPLRILQLICLSRNAALFFVLELRSLPKRKMFEHSSKLQLCGRIHGRLIG